MAEEEGKKELLEDGWVEVEQTMSSLAVQIVGLLERREACTLPDRVGKEQASAGAEGVGLTSALEVV